MVAMFTPLRRFSLFSQGTKTERMEILDQLGRVGDIFRSSLYGHSNLRPLDGSAHTLWVWAFTATDCGRQDCRYRINLK
jgi:hypothetical protein